MLHSMCHCLSGFVSVKFPANELSPEPMEDGDITLRSRVRIRSSSPTRVRATLRASKVALSRSAKVRMRMSVVVPGLSEGMLPPNAQPVTCQEALHHLAKTVSSPGQGGGRKLLVGGLL